MSPLRLELNRQGYLIVPAAAARELFPEDACAAVWRPPELQLVPLRAAHTGGFLMKQRNAAGDRSVLVWEVLPPDFPAGACDAFWDAENQILRLALPYG